MNAKEMGKMALSRLKDAAYTVAEDRLDELERNREKLENYDQAMAEARASQFRRDIKNTIMSYLELKVKDDVIMQLLAKYHHVATIDEAANHISKAKAHYAIQGLESYLRGLKMSDEEIDNFILSRDAYSILRKDPKLFSLSAEKLYSYLNSIKP